MGIVDLVGKTLLAGIRQSAKRFSSGDIETLDLSEEDAGEATEDLDLDLDLGDDIQEEAVEDLDLDLDLGDDVQEEAVEDLDLDLDLGDEVQEEAIEDLDLEPDGEDAEPVDEVSFDAEPEEEVLDDLEELDLDLDESADEAIGLEEEPAEDILDELELNLDLDDAPEEAETPAEAVLDFDLGEEPAEVTLDDLDLGEDVPPAADEPADVELDFADLEMDLETEDAADADDAPGAGADELELDLDLDVSDEEPVETAAAGDSFEMDDELDLSDLEGALDDIGDADGDMAQTFDDSQELELDLDLDSEPEPDEQEESLEMDSAEDLDFSDLEGMLDEGGDVGESESDELDLEMDLDLDLDEEPVAETDEPTLMEDDGELGLYSLDESGDDELQFGLDEEEEEVEDKTMILDPDEQKAAVEAAYAQTVELSPDPEEEIDELEEDPPPSAPAAKKKIGKPVIAALVVVLLAGGLFGGYTVLDGMGIRIPFVSDMISPLPPDPGNLKITTLAINSRFVENSKLGKLFIVSGKIRNDYENARSSVRIVGKLFSQGKKLAATKTVFAGNIVSGPDLAGIELQDINKRLNKPNLTVAPGKLMPFMVIFANLPDDLEEFTIEVSGSNG